VSALVAGGWIVTRNRVDSVKPLHIVTVTSLAPAAATDPQVFLLVGSDSRAFVDTDADRQQFGDPSTIAGERADTIIVVRIDPQTGQNLLVSIPRDLFVDVPGCGEQKINGAFNEQQMCSGNPGGIQLLVQTLTSALGIPVNHVIQMDFPQFGALASELGGIRVDFSQPARDRSSGLDEPAGCNTLTGAQSLAFVRSRHLEWQADGEWHEDPTADIGRMRRQQLALDQLAAAAEARMGTDPRPLLETLFAHVTVDSGFTADDALRYVAALRSTHTTMYTLPATPQTRDGVQGLVLDPTNAQPLLDELAGHGSSVGAVHVPPELGDNPQMQVRAC
jgi:LCP family protein required for cell wall assembly